LNDNSHLANALECVWKADGVEVFYCDNAISSQLVTLNLIGAQWPKIPIYFVNHDKSDSFATLISTGWIPVNPKHKYESIGNWRGLTWVQNHEAFPVKAHFSQSLGSREMLFQCIASKKGQDEVINHMVIAVLKIKQDEYESSQTLSVSENHPSDSVRREAAAVCGYAYQYLSGHLELADALGLSQIITFED
jgi:hypothetical protein